MTPFWQSKPPIYLGRARRESLHAQAPHRAGDGLASGHRVNLLERYDYPVAWAAGLRLEQSAPALWNAFVQAHAAAQLHGPVEIQMDYFTRAVESVLAQGPTWDSLGLQLGSAHWDRAVRDSGYIAAQQTVRANP